MVNIKRLLKKEILPILKEFKDNIIIEDTVGKVFFDSKTMSAGGRDLTDNPKTDPVKGKVLSGKRELEPYDRFPVHFHDQVIGWVSGSAGAYLVAKLLSYLTQLEEEKKLLAKETLEKYKEITLLYSLTERLAQKPDAREIGRLVLDEAKKLIKSDSIAILIIDEISGQFEAVAASGLPHYGTLVLRSGVGLAESIKQTGRAEIINNVRADPRYVGGELSVNSIMYAPLKIKDNVIGIIFVGSEKLAHYTAEDLKMLSVLASQAAFALENVRLNFIRETFGRYLSDDVVNRLLATPDALKLGGEKKQITIMMSDLRGFTSLAERLPPETVVAIINNYLKAMVDVIQKYNGTILEFIGDAIMVIFGAPLTTKDHTVLAVACALEMQLAMAGVNQWNKENGFPSIQMGIGMNTGQVVVGNIGSEKRTKYACVGSQVNMAGRIESYTVGGQILISQETLSAISLISIDIKERLAVTPKGVKEPIIIYDITGIGPPYNLYLSQQKHELLRLTEVIAVKIFFIEDKHCDDSGFDGCLTKISLEEVQEVEICLVKEITVLSNIKIQILTQEGIVLIDEVYGKAKAEEKSGKNTYCCLVQLTSIPHEGKVYLQQLIDKKD